MASQGIYPSKALGGVGWHEQAYGHLALFGKTYLTMRDLGSNNSFDTYLLPEDLLLDGAQHDVGEDYAHNLVETRRYLEHHHPLAMHLHAVADVPGAFVDGNPYMRLEAGADNGKMELAMVSSGVRNPDEAAHKVLIFDLRVHDAGLAPLAPKYITRNSAMYDMLMFPLLHETGKGGFFKAAHAGVLSTKGVRLSLQNYTRAMLMQNPRLHLMGRLAQEYVLVQHSRHVEDMLDFQRHSKVQSLFRRKDAAAPAGDGAAPGAGSRVSMASSVPGSFKYNTALVDDACAVTNVYGAPSLFITFTCNPKWQEITDALEKGQSWEDRADIVNRVFHLKLMQLLDDLREGAIFKTKDGAPWRTKYIMYVVEFQKRGKPHAHITLRFEGEEEEMPKTPKAIDALVSGKLPPLCNCAFCSDASAPPCPVGRRRNAVLKHMMHKCISGVCLPKEGPSVCCRGYPKAPCAETTQDDGGYPIYSRGAGDENVVPHNVALLLRYDSHINVELCTTVWVSKYMHKYMHKGPDSIRLITKDLYANLAASGMNMKDDILKHQVFRYLSAGEALCRTFGYNLSQSSVGCSRLSVHLEGMDWVGDAGESASKTTTLTDYFARPPELHHLRYLQYFSQYSVKKATKAEQDAVDAAYGAMDEGGAQQEAQEDGNEDEDLEVAEVQAAQRGPFIPKRGNVFYIDANGLKVAKRNKGCLHVARMYPVPVTQGELYYLRVLLMHIPATSFTDLRTVGHLARVCDTYREAAEVRGLITAEAEFMEGIASIVQNVPRGLSTIGDIRHTFVMMTVAGGDGVPVRDLYNTFKYFMCLDVNVYGDIGPPGHPKGPLDVRLPIVEYNEEDDDPPTLDAYPVHEFHLLRILEDLLQQNHSRSLEDVGLPTLRGHATTCREGAASPFLQLVLEGYLYAKPDARAPGAPAELELLRAKYVNNFPHLLTGVHLQRVLSEGDSHAGGNADFCKSIDVEGAATSYASMYSTLNPEQAAFVTKAVEGLQYQVARKAALEAGTAPPQIPHPLRFMYLQARGGRGKSYVTKCVIYKAIQLGLLPAVSSFCGVAAILIPLGQTCHRTYGLPLSSSEPAPSSLTTRSAQGQVLANTYLHIIDEIGCFHKYHFEASASVSARCVQEKFGTGGELPFGGAMVLAVGDYHQTLPITTGIVNDDVTLNSIWRSSDIFQRFAQTTLTLPQRSVGDKLYDSWLEALSTNHAEGPVPLERGQLPPTLRRVHIPPQCFRTTDLDAGLTWLFGPPPQKGQAFPIISPLHAFLATLNKDVDEINAKVLDTYVKGRAFTLQASHQVCTDSDGNTDGCSRVHCSHEFMCAATKSGVAPAQITLKEGALVLITRNLLPTRGLVNGTKCIVLSTPPPSDFLAVLHVRTVTQLGRPAEDFYLPRINFEMVTPGGARFHRRQFPVRLAYAMTTVSVNFSQTSVLPLP